MGFYNLKKQTLKLPQELFLLVIVFLIGASVLSLKVDVGTLKMNADGKGYYDYLPATFIYKDLKWGFLDGLETEFYNHKIVDKEIINDIAGGKVNRYSCGTAIMLLPGFTIAHVYALFSSYNPDGYSLPYQYGVLLSAFIWLYLGLFFLRKLLQKLLPINKFLIFVIQSSIVLSTSLFHYLFNEPAFSHVYSFSLIIIFNYLWVLYLDQKRTKYLYFLFIIYGMIALVRPVNLMIIVFLPFYFNNIKEFGQFLKELVLKKGLYLLISFLLFFMVVSLQLFIWKYQTGHFFVDSYSGQGFNFLSPEYINFLFSYRKGVFVYAPILFVVFVLGMISLFRKKLYYKGIILFLAINLVVYVLSSWEFWEYGASFGQRPVIDYYVIFAILMGYGFLLIKEKYSIFLIGLSLCTSVISVIQTYQYKNYILLWDHMTKKKYWSVFLKTDKSYKGYLWFPEYKYSEYQVVDAYTINEKRSFNPNTSTVLVKDLLAKTVDKNAGLVHISFDMQSEDEQARIYFCINSSNGDNIYWAEESTFMEEKNTENWGKGDFYFNIVRTKKEKANKVSVGVITKEGSLAIKNIKIELINLDLISATKEEQGIINSILNNPTWYQSVEEKAKQSGIKVEKQLLLDAQFILSNKKPD